MPSPTAGHGPVTARAGTPESLLRLAATDSALGCAQREAWRVVGVWGLRHIADIVELLTLELVSVALGRNGRISRARYRDLLGVRLVGLRFQLAVEGLVIATWDSDPRPPRFSRPGSGNRDEGELYFVPMLAKAWDFFPSAGGKVVWAEVAIPPPGGQQLPRGTQHPTYKPRLTITDLDLLERVRDGLRRLDVA